jgi:hypothetical protein
MDSVSIGNLLVSFGRFRVMTSGYIQDVCNAGVSRSGYVQDARYSRGSRS